MPASWLAGRRREQDLSPSSLAAESGLGGADPCIVAPGSCQLEILLISWAPRAS